MDHAAVINLLGGPTPVSMQLRCHRTRVSRWRREGIPTSRFPEIVRLARRLARPEITVEVLFRGREMMARRARRLLVVA